MIKNKTIYIFAHSIEPAGTSGSETILIELFKRIVPNFKKIILFTWGPGKKLYQSQGLKSVEYKIAEIPILKNFYVSFITRVLYGIRLGLIIKIDSSENAFLYPSSDFWMDSLPAIILKIRYPKTKLIGPYYLTAPNPFKGFKENNRGYKIPSINNTFYWLMQKPIYIFFKHMAKLIIVTSNPDVNRFPEQKRENNFFVVKGGVNLDSVKKFKNGNKKTQKIYDAVYMGRFHPQKGVLELIDIWTIVVSQKSNAKLVMIGDGPLMQKVKEKINNLGLGENILLTGFILKEDERFKLYNQSKIALHPAIYDSGGMSVAEAMAFGLPAVGFDLEALKTYYPKGILKGKIGDIQDFSLKILRLLNDDKLYKKISLEAENLVKEWNWDLRAREFLEHIKKL